MTVLRILGFRRTVSDLGRALDFYIGGLGFAMATSRVDTQRGVRLSFGAQVLELVSPPDRGVHRRPDVSDDGVASSAFQHFALVTADIGASLRRLKPFAPLTISLDGAAVRLPANSGGALACKFRDPDGHPLELIEFAPGQGSAAPGIDHSAISVSDAARSLAFYGDGLGLTFGSRQINRGAEQARLDGVASAEVDVIGLLPAQGATPHLELLAYRRPAMRSRLQAPLAHSRQDQLIYRVADLPGIRSRLAATFPVLENAMLDEDAWTVRDPDGHEMVLLPA